MARYVDANILQERCDRFLDLAGDTEIHLEDSINGMPTADVVPVVRCRDCMYLQSLNCPLAYIENHTIQFLCRPPEWYCANGERREEK